MSKGLRSWVQANWVDIANPKKGGGFPKCVPASKARAMSASQRASAVSRKKKAESKGRTGKKPNYART